MKRIMIGRRVLAAIMFQAACGSYNGGGTVEASSAAAAAKAGIFSKVDIDCRYFIAGGVCAAVSHGITTPIDVVKTKMQAEPEVYKEGVRDAALSILKTEGPGALLGGLGPTVIGYGIEGAMKFGVYELMKPIVLAFLLPNGGSENEQSIVATAYILASVLAGGVASILLCPMESTRIRIVTDPAYAGLGLLRAFPKMCRESGFFSSFSGIHAMLAKQIPYTMAKQVSFDVVAGILYSIVTERAKNDAAQAAEDLKYVVSVSAAFVASLFACIFSQPGDMILTETYKQDNGRGIFGIVGNIYKTKGLPGFFTGTRARIMHVGAIITSQLVIYDVVKQALGLPATGSH